MQIAICHRKGLRLKRPGRACHILSGNSHLGFPERAMETAMMFVCVVLQDWDGAVLSCDNNVWPVGTKVSTLIIQTIKSLHIQVPGDFQVPFILVSAARLETEEPYELFEWDRVMIPTQLVVRATAPWPAGGPPVRTEEAFVAA